MEGDRRKQQQEPQQVLAFLREVGTRGWRFGRFERFLRIGAHHSDFKCLQPNSRRNESPGSHAAVCCPAWSRWAVRPSQGLCRKLPSLGAYRQIGVKGLNHSFAEEVMRIAGVSIPAMPVASCYPPPPLCSATVKLRTFSGSDSPFVRLGGWPASRYGLIPSLCAPVSCLPSCCLPGAPGLAFEIWDA
jgi:hypothetical protein